MDLNFHFKKNGVSINFDEADFKFSKLGNGFVHQKDFPSSTGGKWLDLNWNRSLVKNILPFLVFLVVYGLNDTIHLLPGINDLHCVNFHNISALEYHIFSGYPPHLFFSSHSSFLLDLLSALPYLIHYSIPVLFPLFLTFGGMKDKIARFFKLLSLAMWSHYFIWFLLPTAPPWLADRLRQVLLPQVSSGGLHQGHHGDLQREGCAFARLDAESGWGFFKRIFDGNPVPFASFPSGHVAWPLCMALTTCWGRRGKAFFSMYIGWVAWSTMYSCHHYFSDILAALVVVSFMEFLERKYWNVRPGHYQ